MNEEFNVVIAEDEKRICSLIKALIDWDGLHLRLVGEAHDGVQALTLLQQEKVDILITDIRMPGVNGLDLTKWVNDHCNQCSVIIISGYKQFDYAYDALRMDVVDFLLKPIKKTDINKRFQRLFKSAQSPLLIHQQFNWKFNSFVLLYVGSAFIPFYIILAYAMCHLKHLTKLLEWNSRMVIS